MCLFNLLSIHPVSYIPFDSPRLGLLSDAWATRIDEIEAIQKIYENVSYSKEKKGKLEKLDFPVSYLSKYLFTPKLRALSQGFYQS